ncbi:hypothetical protein [Streptomyces sp. MN13]
MTDQTTLALLRDTEAYLSALHTHVARHDTLAANLACAGCELRDRIAAVLPQMAAVEPPVDRAAEDHRLALSLALGLGTGAPWDAIRNRADELRRMADEAQPAEAHACTNCEGIDPDTCLMNPERASTQPAGPATDDEARP